jgi:hypothetical protein
MVFFSEKEEAKAERATNPREDFQEMITTLWY